MKLSEVFTQLAYGELSQLALVDSSTGNIAVDKYPVLVAHVNMGLTALYKRFSLKEGRAYFALQEGRLTYILDTEEDINFFESNGDAEFNDDILKIEQVYTANGVELALNDLANPYACMTPTSTSLRLSPLLANQAMDLPDEFKTASLMVVYRANHPLIIVGNNAFTPSKVILELPYAYLEPLLFFVASRVSNPIGMTNEFHAGNSYAAKYEQACVMLEQKNLQVDQGSQYDRLTRNGWV